MSIKPILFNTEMVRAIQNGTKTVTRRVVKPQPVWNGCEMRWFWKNVGWWFENWDPIETITWKHTPYRPGDILYVRETFHQTPNGQYWYKADNLCTGCTEDGFCVPKGVTFHETCKICEYYDGYKNIEWHPSIHMPREAARIFLRVTNVRMERLQDITEEQAVKEGFEDYHSDFGYYEPATIGFVEEWDSIIKKADRALYGWEANPWVWVITFERITREEARP